MITAQEVLYLFCLSDKSICDSFNLVFNLFLFLLCLFIFLITDQTDPMSVFSQPEVSIILAKQQSVFSPTRHHPIRLKCLLGTEIVYENSDISIRTIENQRFLSFYLHGRIDTRIKSLCRRLFITGASVKLSAGKKSVYFLEFKRRLQLNRVDAVILYGVSVPDNFRMLQTGNCTIHRVLHIFRHRA